ncbi:MAG: NgoFVII family restriction endonuclease [Gammaproteobacteria bacterium]|nr:NgoFVII family restriction endonuclease [Gammaproteobacteria bacterium]
MAILISNGIPGKAVSSALDDEVRWTDHLGLVRQLLHACDECLIVSPFLASEFELLLEGVKLSDTRVELISTCAARGSDQLTKPTALKAFGQTVRRSTGEWPTIGLDKALHSKVYIFRLGGMLFAGIVTSANFTVSGLQRNHETGVLIQSPEILQQLENRCRASIDYVSLAEWQIDKLCQAAEIAGRSKPKEEDREIGLTSLLNLYAAPSAGNRETRGPLTSSRCLAFETGRFCQSIAGASQSLMESSLSPKNQRECGWVIAYWKSRLAARASLEPVHNLSFPG